MRDETSHIVIIFFLTLITLNLFILDLKVFSPASSVRLSDISTEVTPIPTQTTSYQLATGNLLCPKSCITLINEATESTKIGSSQQLAVSSQQSVVSREFYIPLGNGNTDNADWADLTATETIIDPQNYGKIKEAYFITSLTNSTQNGQIEARLFNVTDKHMVWGSHVIMNGPKSQTITSDKITLDAGNKLYRVQLRSSLRYSAVLDNAKIRIITGGE